MLRCWFFLSMVCFNGDEKQCLQYASIFSLVWRILRRFPASWFTYPKGKNPLDTTRVCHHSATLSFLCISMVSRKSLLNTNFQKIKNQKIFFALVIKFRTCRHLRIYFWKTWNVIVRRVTKGLGEEWTDVVWMKVFYIIFVISFFYKNQLSSCFMGECIWEVL